MNMRLQGGDHGRHHSSGHHFGLAVVVVRVTHNKWRPRIKPIRQCVAAVSQHVGVGVLLQADHHGNVIIVRHVRLGRNGNTSSQGRKIRRGLCRGMQQNNTDTT
jgi:hypothetical protein